MFDPVTAEFLKSAPAVQGLNPSSIPALLTRHYANLVSERLRGGKTNSGNFEEEWPLERIADTYELITSIQKEEKLRKAAAFVAGTAQQIIARRQLLYKETNDNALNQIDREHVAPSISAILLFLAAEQYADANEAASLLKHYQDSQRHEVNIIIQHISDLASGKLRAILGRAKWRKPKVKDDLEDQALTTLLETLTFGIELLAGQLLVSHVPSGRFSNARDAFSKVLQLSSGEYKSYQGNLGGKYLITYPGPHHLASLLIAVHDGISQASLVSVLPPDGADTNFWKKWLQFQAESFPFVWPNHREALAQGFHQTGKSAVVVLPTGAGKTTISSIKIAGALARRKKAVFLAPTHALVEQLTDDLQKMFPKEILGSVVSSDFDLLFQKEAQLKEIEVMTPEGCLSMLSFTPDAFSDVGLLVFDECHILNPQPGKMRRALDSMLCLMSFNHVIPSADLLFLSAMLKNGEEFSAWIKQITGRQCVSIDLLWKPSRQARGVLIYKQDDLDQSKSDALRVQAEIDEKKGKTTKGLRSAAQKELVIQPWAIWGLQHNWLQGDKAQCIVSQVLDSQINLSGDKRNGTIRLRPNANKVAIQLAISAANNNLKSIVFVNKKSDSISVAKEISQQVNNNIEPTEAEQKRWDALKCELGDLKHAIISHPSASVPHNSLMLRLERELSEKMFKRKNGASVIVATPTLAQGLNLPAHLAIIAGDKRMNVESKEREDLSAHEILNSAARAGRAGHLANGIVLLVPDPVISLPRNKTLDSVTLEKLKSILPEDDRCVTISDPLEVVLDNLMQGYELDADVRYLINRMSAVTDDSRVDRKPTVFNFKKSFGAFLAQKKKKEKEFHAKSTLFENLLSEEDSGNIDETTIMLMSKSGLPKKVISNLQDRINSNLGTLPIDIEGWLNWILDWLIGDHDAQLALLEDTRRSILGACGVKKDAELTENELILILPGIIAWVKGEPLAIIEEKLGGVPSGKFIHCPRARDLVGNVIPRSLSFIVSIVTTIVEESKAFDAQKNLSRQLIECLGTAVRKGYDTPEKVYFSGLNKSILSRVQVHQQWNKENPEELF